MKTPFPHPSGTRDILSMTSSKSVSLSTIVQLASSPGALFFRKAKDQWESWVSRFLLLLLLLLLLDSAHLDGFLFIWSFPCAPPSPKIIRGAVIDDFEAPDSRKILFCALLPRTYVK